MTTDYRPPLRAMTLPLRAAGLDELLPLPAFEHLSAADIEDVLEGFGRFSAEVIAPTDRIGNTEGTSYDPT